MSYNPAPEDDPKPRRYDGFRSPGARPVFPTLDDQERCTDEQYTTCPHELNLENGLCSFCGRYPPAPKKSLTPKRDQAELDNILSAPERGLDMVNLPHHYARFKIEPIRYCVENKLNFLQANIVKYSARYDAKNGLEDCAKVVRNSIMLLRMASGDPDWWRPDPFTPEIMKSYGSPYVAR